MPNLPREEPNRLSREHFELVQELAGPGLRLIDAETGGLAFEPLEVEVDERRFWWRP